MIRWPDERRCGPAARKSLPQFRATSAAEDLAADPHTWELEATSWLAEFPVRLLWRNEEGREVRFTVEETGLWTLVPCETFPVPPNPDDPLSTAFEAGQR